MKKTARNVILFDDNEVRKHLMPFTYTRPTALLRVGITTISEKWQAMLGEATYSYLTARYLKKKFPLHVRRTTNLMVAGHVIPTPELAEQVLSLQEGEALMAGEELVAFYGTAHDYDARFYTRVHFAKDIPLIVRHLYDLFEFNGVVLEQDFNRLTAGRQSQPLSSTNTVIGDPERIFVEEGAYVEGAKLNTNAGPIYIGRDVEVMEGAATVTRHMMVSSAMPSSASGVTSAAEPPPAISRTTMARSSSGTMPASVLSARVCSSVASSWAITARSVSTA